MGKNLYDASTLTGYEGLASAIGLRRLQTAKEELRCSGGEGAIQRASVTAVIANPWLGMSVETDLNAEVCRIAPVIAKLLSDRLLDALGSAEAVAAFGKAAVVGLQGETEHAAAFTHTPYFGNLMREALLGTSIICFVDARSEPGMDLWVPLWHKTEAATRDYYQSLCVSLEDAPHANEIAVIAAASTGPRLHARIGDRKTDPVVTSEILKEIEL